MNWRITTYDEENNIIDTWIIENRTENEAFKEAEADCREAYDWTMVKT